MQDLLHYHEELVVWRSEEAEAQFKQALDERINNDFKTRTPKITAILQTVRILAEEDQLEHEKLIFSLLQTAEE